MMAQQIQNDAVSLEYLLEGVVTVAAAQDRFVADMQLDSRKVQPGCLFVALQGVHEHGARFIESALERGASAVICEKSAVIDEASLGQIAERYGASIVFVDALGRCIGSIAARFFAFPADQVRVIGVTGTNGKTSVSHFVAQLLGLLGESCGVMGTMGYGRLDNLLPSEHTTPDPIELHRRFAAIQSQSAKAAAIELSSHGLAQHRVQAVQFDSVIWTNLSRDHLDYHETIEEYAQAKFSAFLDHPVKTAVINLDDEYGCRLLDLLPAAVCVIGYTICREQVAQDRYERCEQVMFASDYSENNAGLSFMLGVGEDSHHINSSLHGRFNVSNLLASIAACNAAGYQLERVIDAVASVHPVKGRLEYFTEQGRPGVIVDYAHTPDALHKLLQSARLMTVGKLVCVFGCGGNRDTGKRAQMGGIAGQLADRVVLTNDNPRSEAPEKIIQDIVAGLPVGVDVSIITDREKAIQQAIAEAAPGDLVVIAGKGHEDYQVIGDKKSRFVDQDVARTALTGYTS